MSATNLPDSLAISALLEGDLDLLLELAHIGEYKGLSAETESRQLHYNKPQLRSMAVEASEEYAIWGRGTGKSEGRIAPRTFRNVQVMPRGHGCFVGATYLQLLERTLPPVVKGWENMGWKRGRDFWIRERPPKSLNIPEPIVGPLTAEHCIFFRNGAVASMVSQDRPGSANGKTVHWIVGDEAKLLNKQSLDNELLMTNRGDERYFGGIPEFHSLLFCTDMPTTASAQWILEQEKRMDPKRIQALLAIQAQLYELNSELVASPPRRKSLVAKINHYQAKWDAIRANTVYVSFASTFDNLHGFGLKQLKELKEKLPPFIFSTAILNRKPAVTEHGFYPDLTDEHAYDHVDYSYVESQEFGKGNFSDSRKDGDVNRYAPLDIAMDNNGSINTLAVGQLFGRSYKILNALYVMHPQKLQQLIDQFCAYYKHHPRKEVNFYYDHTANYTTAKDPVSFSEDVARWLTEKGWKVNMVYLGQTTSYQYRYSLWGRALTGGDQETYSVSFNRQNTEYLRTSMQRAQIKQGKDGYEKEKKDEKNLSLDQRGTTHFSDAGDTLLVGAHYQHKFNHDRVAMDAVFAL